MKSNDEEVKMILQKGPNVIDYQVKAAKRKVTSTTELLAENTEFANLCRGKIKEVR